ncbi:MAG: ATP-binding cassette domain-containing protein [Paracoccaceae bacterium]
MLQLDDLILDQGTFRLAADWSLPPATKLAIIGPSGAGKSTLLHAIAGFITPTQGRILWNGADLRDTPPGARPVSILFQDQNLFPHLTIARNLALGLNPRLSLSAAEWAQVDDTLTKVGLADMGHRRPAELSGGQQSRAALARALLRARPLLLLDEPFAALGPALKAEMMALVAEVASATQATTLMVTHDPADARRHADLTVLVADGTAHAPRPTADLFANPPDALRAYLGDQ